MYYEKFKKLFGEEWYYALEHVIKSEYFKKLGKEIADQRSLYTIYPEKNSDLLFKAFRTTPISKVKVIIQGQDIYHDGSYDGFCFSNKGKLSNFSPSLRNIFREVENDVYDGLNLNQDNDLERWAKQGILLTNTGHTVIEGKPGSHIELWKPFSKEVIRVLLKQNKPKVWILWGKFSQNLFEEASKNSNFDTDINFLLKSPHPSPFSASTGFFGSKPFSKTNEYLESKNISKINW